MTIPRDNYSRFINVGDLLLKRGNRPLGLKPLAKLLNMNVGEVRGCIDAIKSKHGSTVFVVTTKGTYLGELGQSLLKSLKELPSQTKPELETGLPQVMIDGDIERQFFTQLSSDRQQELDALSGCRLLPMNLDRMTELLASGKLCCAIGWRRSTDAPPCSFHTFCSFPLCVVTPPGHWLTVEGTQSGSLPLLNALDRLAYLEADASGPGIRESVQALRNEQRVCCTSYASVMQYALHGKLGLMPLNSDWLKKHTERLDYRLVDDSISLGIFHQRPFDTLPNAVQKLLSILQSEATDLASRNEGRLRK